MKVIKPNQITLVEYMAVGDNPLLPTEGWNYNYEIAQGILAWNPATSYVAGDRCYSATTNKVYLATAPGVNHDPTTDTTGAFWVPAYYVNAWRPFDGIVGNPSYGYYNGVNAGGAALTPFYAQITLRPRQRFDTLVMLNVNASTITVSINPPDGGIGYYKSIASTVDTTPIVDAWTYFFVDCPIQRNFVIEDVGFWYDPAADEDAGYGTVLITITGVTDPVSVGEIVLGNAVTFGRTLENASLTLVDYSTKDVNQYGEATIVSRAYSYRAAFDVTIDPGLTGVALNAMADLRNIPCVYYPDEAALNKGLVVYGYCTDFRLTNRVSGNNKDTSFANIQVEGLT